MGLTSFSELALVLTAGAHAADKSHHRAMERACTILETSAKDAIGTYEFGWPQLAESTQQQRVSLGFPANEPLLRSGELQRSIGHVVESDGRKGYVGTNDPVAPWQEFGTSKIPPRPFLGGALAAKGEEAANCFPHEAHMALERK